jgi:hypothetical protein
MTVQTFEETLLSFKRREPFEPFVVQLRDGRTVEVDEPEAVVFAGSGASFLSPDYEIISFRASDVLSIRPASPEAAS